MNGHSSFPTPDSSPIAGTLAAADTPPEPPPVVAPPVVHAAACDDAACDEPDLARALPTDQRSPLRRGLRDVMIGAVCLLVGLIAASSDSLLRKQAGSFAIVSAAAPQPQDVLLTSDVIDVPDVQPAMVATPVAPVRASLNSVAAVELLDTQPQPVVETVESEIAVDVIDQDDQSDIEEQAYSTDSFESDDVEQPAGVTIAASDKPAVSHAQVSLPVTHQPTAVFADAAATLDAIVNAAATIPSLPDLKSQSTIIPGPQCESGSCQQTSRSLNTVLNWANTPADAYRQAGETEKLVFLIHVSGNFEIPGFT